MVDHYPHVTIADAPPIVAPAAPAGRFVKRGAYMICTTCNMAIEYCPGHAASPVGQPSADAIAENNLIRRITEARTRGGGECGR